MNFFRTDATRRVPIVPTLWHPQCSCDTPFHQLDFPSMIVRLPHLASYAIQSSSRNVSRSKQNPHWNTSFGVGDQWARNVECMAEYLNLHSDTTPHGHCLVN